MRMTMPAAQVKVDLSRFKPEMARLKSELPKRSKAAMTRVAVKLIFLMKREPPCPKKTGRLKESIEDDVITQDKVVVGPHTEYAAYQNRLSGFVDDAAADIQPEIVPIFAKEFRGLTK